MRLLGLRTLLSTLLALTSPILPAQTTPVQTASIQPDRLAASPDLTTRVPLAGHVPAWATPARDQGAVPASTPVSLTLALTRSPQLQAAFDQLLLDQQNPTSPRYHQWLTPQQVGDQYGPTQNDLDAVTAWLTAQGLHVDSIAPSRIFIQASAPASTVSAVFQTSLHAFTHLNRSLMEPTSEPLIPAALSPVIAYIQGLAQVDYRTFSKTLGPISAAQTNIRSRSAPTALQPDFNVTGGSITYHFLAPADFATIYDVPTSVTGASQKVAIIGGSRLLSADLTNWESISGLASYQPNYIVPPASACGTTTSSVCSDPGVTNTGDQDEGTLDFERAYGTAPGATVDQIISANWLNGTVTYELIQYAINTVNDPILTMSFGACEPEQTTQYLAFENSVFTQAASQGISVFASSGDSGAAGCEASGGNPPTNQASNTVAISDICASAAVTCVGGTQFSDTANPSLYWSSSNNSANGKSALSYIPEGAWNEPTYTTSSGDTAYSISATGGGVSTYTAKPSFQVATGVPADGARDVPDISFSASTHNAYFTCLAYESASCVAGSNGSFSLTGIGGTSASAPSMAGIAALLDQKLAGRQGNINPLLYKLYARTPLAFHDPTPATSGVTACSTASASTCNNSLPSATALTGGTVGYPLTTGFDLATGLGSLDVGAFLTAATTAALATTTTLTAAPTTITTAQTVVFTATVASNTAGTPTGSVQFTSNGTSLGSAITLASGTAATPSLPFTTAGTYSIVATYSGDTVYAASSNTISFVVTTPVLPATTTTLTGTASSITTQQTVSYTASISSTASGSPTGSVQFVRTSGTSVNIGSPITLSGGRAILPATSVPAGTFTITAVYSGDTNFSGSTSAGVPLTVTAVATTTGISLPTAPSVTSTTSQTFTATVTPSTSGNTAPTGTVQFTVDSLARGSAVTLSGTSATSAGITLTPGTHSIAAVYSGDAIYAASTSTFDTVTSTLTPTSIAFTTAPTTAVQNASTTFVANVSGLSASVATTASVKFVDTTTGLTLASPTIVYSGSTATATLTTTFTSTGNHILSATFAGDTNYAASNTATSTIAITAPPTFNLASASSTLTLASASSQSGTDVITAATTSGFTGSIAFTCTVALTSGASASVPPTCSLSASSITFPAATTTTVILSTVAPHAVPGTTRSALRALYTGATLACAGLLLFTLPLARRRTPWRALAGFVLLAGSLVTLAGCGGLSGTISITPPGGTTTTTPTGGTTTGAYTVTVTGSATGIANTTTTISLTVN